jgi:alkyl hydroperoxide reductase subunit AhpC
MIGSLTMSLQLGDAAPDFSVDTTQGVIRFHDYLGDGWGVLFSHPGDFTPVCTTELGAAAAMKPEFDARGVKLLGLSVDSLESHHEWESDIGETMGTEMNFPVIADVDGKVSELYGMIHPGLNDTQTVRAVFVVDPAKRIQLILLYPMTTGRNFAEILRAIDALQVSAADPVATPANWVPGRDVIIGLALDDEEARHRFPGFRAVKPYLRLTEQPRRESAAEDSGAA